MTHATQHALERVDQILHEAGWDQSTEPEDRHITPAKLTRLRQAYQSLIRSDHLDILLSMLRYEQSVEETAARMGLSAAAAEDLFHEAIHRLREFMEVSNVGAMRP